MSIENYFRNSVVDLVKNHVSSLDDARNHQICINDCKKILADLGDTDKALALYDNFVESEYSAIKEGIGKYQDLIIDIQDKRHWLLINKDKFPEIICSSLYIQLYKNEQEYNSSIKRLNELLSNNVGIKKFIIRKTAELENSIEVAESKLKVVNLMNDVILSEDFKSLCLFLGVNHG